MSVDVALEDLWKGLRAREVPTTRDDVQWAFSAKSSRQEAVDFVEQYLTAETLLSRNELDLYQRLERNGTVRNLSASHDLSLVRPILEDEIQAAVNSIGASTLAIERQNEILLSQCAALSAFREQDKQTKAQSEAMLGQRHRKQEQEKQHVGLALDELFQKVSSELKASYRRLRAATATILTVLAERLKRDDRLLSNPEKLTTGLTCLNGCDREWNDRSLTLCKALATHVAEAIRYRLDRIYMQASRSCVEGWVPINDPDRCSSAQEEMSCLYSEITAVAEMSVNSEFENPLLSHFKLKHRKGGDHASSVLDFLDTTVSHLHRRAYHFTTIIQNRQSYELTIQVLSDKVNAIDSHQPRNRLCSLNKLKLGDPDWSVHLQPTRETSSIISESYESDSVFSRIISISLRQFLGLLGFSSNIDSDCELVRDTLRMAVLDREHTTRAHPSSQDLADTALLAHLHNAAETTQLLADVLYADSADGRFRFVDSSIEKRTLGLESAIRNIGRCMAGTGLDVLQQGDGTKDDFVNSWAT